MAADRYTKYCDETGFFEAPALVHSLDDVPEDFRLMYEPHFEDPGKYVLTEDGRELRDWAIGERDRQNAEYAERMAEKDAAIQRLRNDKTNAAIDGAIGSDLIRAGVKKTLLRGATALVRQGCKFEVEPSDDGDGNTVLVHTDFGLVSVSDVVEAFLDSDEGAGFRGARQVRPAEGTFAAMIKKSANI